MKNAKELYDHQLRRIEKDYENELKHCEERKIKRSKQAEEIYKKNQVEENLKRKKEIIDYSFPEYYPYLQYSRYSEMYPKIHVETWEEFCKIARKTKEEIYNDNSNSFLNKKWSDVGNTLFIETLACDKIGNYYSIPTSHCDIIAWKCAYENGDENNDTVNYILGREQRALHPSKLKTFIVKVRPQNFHPMRFMFMSRNWYHEMA